jgi:hypothetical protein
MFFKKSLVIHDKAFFCVKKLTLKKCSKIK